MYLAFICNIKSLPHLALCIFYLIKIEAVNWHVFPCVQFRVRVAESKLNMLSLPRVPQE